MLGDDKLRRLTIAAPKEYVEIPAPPPDAPDEQLLDFGAVCGAGALQTVDVAMRIGRAYLRKWYGAGVDKTADGR